MNRKVIRLLLLVSLLTFLAAPVSATTAGGVLDLAFIAKKAGVIFAGTVDSVRYGMDPAGETVLTHVYFGNVVYAKGDRQPGSLVLTLRGGKTSKDWSCVIGQPAFESLKRYIVMAHSDLGSVKNMYLPIIGLDSGFFPLVPDSSSGVVCVYDRAFRPVARIRQRHIVVVDRLARGPVYLPPYRDMGGEPPIEILPPSQDPGTRVHEGEFLGALRDLGR